MEISEKVCKWTKSVFPVFFVFSYVDVCSVCQKNFVHAQIFGRMQTNSSYTGSSLDERNANGLLVTHTVHLFSLRSGFVTCTVANPPS